MPSGESIVDKCRHIAKISNLKGAELTYKCNYLCGCKVLSVNLIELHCENILLYIFFLYVSDATTHAKYHISLSVHINNGVNSALKEYSLEFLCSNFATRGKF